MAFLTLEGARGASGFREARTLAEAELRKSARVSMDSEFDVFLSHARLDADVIFGVKKLIEQRQLTVYVDWIEDPQLDRSRVRPATAKVLRERMRHCACFVFATSDSSPSSKWMPWELGYFDGFRPGHIGILPLVASANSSFLGQEYLGLYPDIEDIRLPDGSRGLGLVLGTDRQYVAPLERLKSTQYSVIVR